MNNRETKEDAIYTQGHILDSKLGGGRPHGSRVRGTGTLTHTSYNY